MATKKDGQAYSDEFKEKVLARVKAGEPVSKIGSSSGVHFGTIYGWMKQAGVTPGKSPKTAKAKLNGHSMEPNVRDTLIYLRHAKQEILKEAGNSGKMSRAHLLSLLALDTLEGN